jgi:hypothetical protein
MFQKTPAPNLAKSNHSPFSPLSQIDFSQNSSFPQQQTTVQYDNLVPISSSQPITNYNLMDDFEPSTTTSADVQITSQSIPVVPSPSETKRSSTSTEIESTASLNENNSSLSKTKKKRRLTNFLPLPHKQKNEKKKDQIDEEVSNSYIDILAQYPD